jgi:hypothetical protein
VKAEPPSNTTNSTVAAQTEEIPNYGDPFAELAQKPFVNLAQRPKAVSLLQIDQQVVSDQKMSDHFQIEEAVSEESFFQDVVGTPQTLVEVNSTKMND